MEIERRGFFKSMAAGASALALLAFKPSSKPKLPHLGTVRRPIVRVICEQSGQELLYNGTYKGMWPANTGAATLTIDKWIPGNTKIGPVGRTIVKGDLVVYDARNGMVFSAGKPLRSSRLRKT